MSINIPEHIAKRWCLFLREKLFWLERLVDLELDLVHMAAATLSPSRYTVLSHSVVSDSLRPHGLYSLPGSSVHGDSPGKNIGADCCALLQGIFPTQVSNPSLPHCGWILYHLSHEGSPRILEWVAYPFFSGSSQPRNWTRVSCIAGGFFTSWATRDQQRYQESPKRSRVLS